MKHIKNFFKSNPELIDEPEVAKLIEYCQELEGDLFEKKQIKKNSKEDELLSFIRELHNSCISLEDEQLISERFHETPPIDFRESMKNLRKYIEKFSRDNFINL